MLLNPSAMMTLTQPGGPLSVYGSNASTPMFSHNFSGVSYNNLAGTLNSTTTTPMLNTKLSTSAALQTTAASKQLILPNQLLPMMSPLMKPGQKLFWEFLSPDGRQFYYDVEKHVSQWERPDDNNSISEIMIINAQKYQEQMLLNCYNPMIGGGPSI